MGFGGGYLLWLIWLWPAVHIAMSPRSRGGAMVGWLILALAFSWVAYGVYLIVTQPRLDAKK